MTYQIGDKVKVNENPGEVLKVLKNGKVKVAYWVQGGFMQKPELWKDTFRENHVERA